MGCEVSIDHTPSQSYSRRNMGRGLQLAMSLRQVYESFIDKWYRQSKLKEAVKADQRTNVTCFRIVTV